MIKNYDKFSAHFLKSVPTIHHLLNFQSNIAIAFIGYVNSGKSSSINALTHQKNLSKTSQTPGSTKLINLFKTKLNTYFIDFPGYGYSKNKGKQKNYWYYAILKYLKKSNNLKGLIIITDIRHAIKDLDQKIIHHTLQLNIPIILLLNKSDKISKHAATQILLNIKKKTIIHYATINNHIKIKMFSAIKKHGITTTTSIINNLII